VTFACCPAILYCVLQRKEFAVAYNSNVGSRDTYFWNTRNHTAVCSTSLAHQNHACNISVIVCARTPRYGTRVFPYACVRGTRCLLHCACCSRIDLHGSAAPTILLPVKASPHLR
ncbi:unnamed protein product, partial [Laminaria digitata]